MTWKTILVIASLICLGFATFGFSGPFHSNLLAAGMFFFVAMFISIKASATTA